jgi:hypothetical protein
MLRMFPLLLACQAACGCRLRGEASRIDGVAAIHALSVVALSQALKRRFDLSQFVAVALNLGCADLVDCPATGQILGVGHTRARVGAVVSLAMLCQFQPELRCAPLERSPDKLHLFLSRGVHEFILGSQARPVFAPDQAKLRSASDC